MFLISGLCNCILGSHGASPRKLFKCAGLILKNVHVCTFLVREIAQHFSDLLNFLYDIGSGTWRPGRNMGATELKPTTSKRVHFHAHRYVSPLETPAITATTRSDMQFLNRIRSPFGSVYSRPNAPIRTLQERFVLVG